MLLFPNTLNIVLKQYKHTFNIVRNVCEIKEKALESSENIKSGIELMRTKHCLKYAAKLCSQPCGKLYLLDENSKKYPIGFDCKNCEMVIYSP